MKAVWIILIIIVLLAIWAVSSYNGFLKLRNKCQEAFATMDVSLKRRYDLIPNLVETVKGYAAHEASTLENVIAARNSAVKATSSEEKIASNNDLTSALRSIFALAENYPELKANTNFVKLQEQLGQVEDEIAASRRYYNGVVNAYNTKIEMFPGNILAGMFGFKRNPLYEVNDAAERENVKVSF